MLASVLLPQLFATIQIFSPFIILYIFLPHFLLTMPGILLCSLSIGMYVLYVHYKQSKNLNNGLKFIPSGDYADTFNKMIAECGFNPKEICLRYAYADDGIAMSLFNTIIIDPGMWLGFEGDPESVKACEVIEKYVLPNVPENKKLLHAQVKKIMSPNVQSFIFKHELGHFFYNYSNKRIVLFGVLGFLAGIFGFLAVSKSIGMLGALGAWIFGILIFAIVDLLLGYANNLFFKSREEKKADIFATQFCSKQEIEGAADFFAQYEQYAQEYKENIGGYISTMPTMMLSGYINGYDRAKYLKDIARFK